jgi:hypothetical protein
MRASLLPLRSLLFASMFAASAFAQQAGIINSLGVDPSVDYTKLPLLGPWDDRNYQLTKADLALLPKNDNSVPGVPAFFLVEYRKQNPTMAGQIFYPRSLRQQFMIFKGGLFVDGRYEATKNDGEEGQFFRGNPVITDQPISALANANEFTIEQNPFNPLRIIAGGNGSGQVQFFSADGGVTWSSATGVTSTCCDASLEWSVDGSVAYAATLGTPAVGSGFRATVFRSTDQGQTWAGRVDISTASSDKEFIHVDRFPTSPFRDNVYLSWHQSNIQFFSRSTDKGLTWATPTSFPGAPTGIGSDLTTDKLGRLYYFYPALLATDATCNANSIRMLRSDDGGLTFVNPASTKVVGLCGRFEAAVPSMETRRTFIYTSVDTDMTTGPNAGRMYVAYTDAVPPTVYPYAAGTAANNHVAVKVVFSDDQGTTWSAPSFPHPSGDFATVDRFHPWLDVDANGVVHIGYYDTVNSGAARNKVDFYYNFSTDGGVTWATQKRVSSVTSENITNGQEWGDYNGLSVNLQQDRILSVWTDNRITAGTPAQRAYVGSVENLTDGPSYGVTAANATQDICAATLPVNAAPVVLSYSAQNGFSAPIAVTTVGPLPTGLSVNLSAPSLTPPGNISASATFNTGIAPGTASVTVNSTSGTLVRNSNLTYNVVTKAARPPSLSAPANNAVGAPLAPVLQWQAVPQAASYLVELATSAAFTTIVAQQTTTATSFTVPTTLTSNTQYFWRVRASNICPTVPNADLMFANGFEDLPSGPSTSPVFSFTTQSGPGTCATGTTTTTVFSEDMETGATGWTHSAVTGSDNWALSTAFPFAGLNAYRGVAHTAQGDQRLVSPTIAIPAGSNQRFLRFQQRVVLEANPPGCYDGGILEISTDGGATFTQVTAGISGLPYTGAISATALSGLQGWCGETPASYQLTAVDLAPYGGQSVQFRFRLGSDVNTSRPDGWNIDDVRVVSCTP